MHSVGMHIPGTSKYRIAVPVYTHTHVCGDWQRAYCSTVLNTWPQAPYTWPHARHIWQDARFT